MKKIITNLCFLLFALSLNATIRTVSNSPATLAQYNSIQAAIDASANGDTVYVHASSIFYTDATINNKNIKIFGSGWSPNTIPNAHSKVSYISLTGNCDGSQIHGMYFTGGIYMPNISNVSIIRNYFKNGGINFGCGNYISTNLLIESNYFDNGYIATDPGCASDPNWHTKLLNSLIINNIFTNLGGTYQTIYNFKQSNNVVFEHNLFYGPGTIFKNGSENFILINNIFVNCNPSSINCIWQNNITYNCSGTNAPWTLGTNTGTGNIENQDPQMVDQSSVNANIANPLLNFTISTGPSNDAGTDGKDLGLLFDLTGYLNWSNSRNPKLPVVNSLLINSTANPGGNLEIHLNASQAK